MCCIGGALKGLSALLIFYFLNATVEPSVLVKYVKPVPVQFDAGVRVIYKEKVWIGGAYRHLDALTASFGFLYRENLMLSYAYDFTTTNLRNYSTGTHELMIGIRFNRRGVGK
jgi:type IX secretion system PorP/SprF family membrane protein